MLPHLPPLSPEMAAHTKAVTAHLQDEIDKSGGAISFARFMELALYAPGLGYYAAGATKFGKNGDFITAPEISPLFGKALARQFADILRELPKADILELGAGSGLFAKDVLLELQKGPELPAHYFILETSADLRQRQQALLKEACPCFFSRLVWLDRLPDTFRGIIFANEVLDALPVHCFRIENQAVKERCVTFNNKQFEWLIREPLSAELTTKVAALIQDYALPDGYESEINLVAPAWISTLAKTLHEGVMLFFDYGYGRGEYYHPQRNSGTLRCYYQQRCHADPFILVGLQDLTAQVDFTSLAESSLDAKLDVAGYTTQSAFLMATGINDFLQEPASSRKHYQQNQALKLLMLPSEMGTLIKAIAFTKQWEKPLRGFALFDKRQEL
jgi:SAM-dependent MidA family methyltransferase